MYKVYLAQSSDMEYIGDITYLARGKSLEVGLNRSGSFSFEIPFDNIHREDFVCVKNCIVVEKNNVPVWSGPIWNINKNYPAAKNGISCVGWFEILKKRFLQISKTYTTQTDGYIAYDLLSYANSQQVESTTYPTWITAGTNTSVATRDMKYEQNQNIGQEIENLTEIESGFNFSISPITRILDIYAWNDYDDLTSVVWGYNWGPNNLLDFSEEISADSMANQQYFAGKTIIAEAHDTTSLTYHGQLFQDIQTLTEINNNDVLGAYANAELVVKKNPKVVYSMTPKQVTNQNNVPSIFEDFQLGDKTYLTAKSDGEEVLNQGVKIFGASITIDEEDNERITSLQTTYQG